MRDSDRQQCDDWRKQGQERYLSRVRLLAQSYRAYREGSEHDHVITDTASGRVITVGSGRFGG
jgi:hypothetical protein